MGSPVACLLQHAKARETLVPRSSCFRQTLESTFQVPVSQKPNTSARWKVQFCLAHRQNSQASRGLLERRQGQRMDLAHASSAARKVPGPRPSDYDQPNLQPNCNTRRSARIARSSRRSCGIAFVDDSLAFAMLKRTLRAPNDQCAAFSEAPGHRRHCIRRPLFARHPAISRNAVRPLRP